jgi:uncharacterized protein DUF6766
MSDALIVAITLLMALGISGVLVVTLVRAITKERRSSGLSKIWSNFGLSLSFAALFLVSWVAQAVAEWGTFRQEQVAHGQPLHLGDFLVQFGQSTFENWQSEFLQLFSFVVFSALLIHHGSAESKDGTDRIEESVKRIERRLDAAGIGSGTT